MDARKEGVSASAGTLHGQNEEAIVPDKAFLSFGATKIVAGRISIIVG